MLSPRVPNLVPILVPGWSAKPLVNAYDRIMGTHRVAYHKRTATAATQAVPIAA